MGVMKRHPKIGYDIVSTLPEMEAAAAIVFTHHERFDGKGYPRHLGASEISLGAKIFRSSTLRRARFDRCYHKGVSKEIALAE
jgi:HD-GYP domain-containing protein (c-di-GMP phosphodiesterase class II)